MKNLHSLIAVFIFALVLNPVALFAQGGGTQKGTNVIKFDKAKHEADLKKLFEGNTMGYQVVLIKDGKIVSEVAGGYARVANDGEAKMTVNTPANIGSTAKFFAGTALLQLFQKPNKQGGNIDAWLAEPAYRYLPKVWQDAMHPTIKLITFKDLLQHKGGFIQNDPDADIFFDYLKKGVSTDLSKDYAHGKSHYANANIGAVGYMLPAVADPTFLTKLNQTIVNKKLKAGDVEIETMLGNAFESYIKGKIFSTTTPVVHPSCDAPTEYAAKKITFAMTYTVYNDITKGVALSPKNGHSAACHAAGGWYISARELAAYVANFSATDTIVNSATRKKMFNDDAPTDRLLWSFATGDPDLAKNFGWNSTPFMGGDQGGSHGTIMMLPGGYYAVGIVNSNVALPDKSNLNGNSTLLTKNIIHAFDAGMADNFK